MHLRGPARSWGQLFGSGVLVLCLSFLGAACGSHEQEAPDASSPPAAKAAPVPAANPAAVRKAPPSPFAEQVRKISDIPVEIEDPAKALQQIKPWLGNEQRDLREAAILALWDLETDASSQELARVAKREKDPELRGYAVEELVDREAPEAVDALLLTLQDEDTDLRESSAEGLEELEDARAKAGLYRQLGTEKDEWVRDAIISALETIDPSFDEDKYAQ